MSRGKCQTLADDTGGRSSFVIYATGAGWRSDWSAWNATPGSRTTADGTMTWLQTRPSNDASSKLRTEADPTRPLTREKDLTIM